MSRRGFAIPKFAGVAVAALALELTLLDLFSIHGARAEILLALACFAALFARTPQQGLMTAWILGLIKDLGSAGPLGLHALLFLAMAAAVLRARRPLDQWLPVMRLALPFMAACAVNFATALFVSVTSGALSGDLMVTRILVSAFATALAAPVLFLILGRVRWLVQR